MSSLVFVVNQPEKLRKLLPPNGEALVLTARDYLLAPPELNRRAKVYNLCSSTRYQSVGYYVSLLAEARGHKALPSIATLQDFNDQANVRFFSRELGSLIQKSLEPILAEEFTLSVYFGKNLAKRYDKLCSHLYGLFPAPLMRASFQKRHNGWSLRELKPISLRDTPEDHQPFLADTLSSFLAGKRLAAPAAGKWRYDLAILHNPKEKHPPSDPKALNKFVRAAEAQGLRVEMIEKKDIARLNEFDALFIRETTQVNHHTYQFARRAQAEGLVVIDDPESILKCTNKVFLAELMARCKIPTPRSMIIHRQNAARAIEEIGFPCILKQPDSSFSAGVRKASDAGEFERESARMFEESELAIVQEYLPSEFDWRVGVFNRKPIYACKYYMARKHWQIRREDQRGRVFQGKDEGVPVGWVPRPVLSAALKAANAIGDGLYGVDLKEIDGKVYLIEVNDNPSIDADVEDAVSKDELYQNIMSVILSRIEERKK